MNIINKISNYKHINKVQGALWLIGGLLFLFNSEGRFVNILTGICFLILSIIHFLSKPKEQFKNNVKSL